MTRVTVGCDGSALGNPGPSGWAWWVDEQCWDAGNEKVATNNQMELVALIEVLRSAPDGVALRVHCDSQYVIKALTVWIDGWRSRDWKTSKGTPVANRELIEQAAELMDGRDVDLVWVKGHSTDVHNQRADRLAHGAATRASKGEDAASSPGWAA